MSDDHASELLITTPSASKVQMAAQAKFLDAIKGHVCRGLDLTWVESWVGGRDSISCGSCQVAEEIWWTWSGSNRRPLPCHGSALPAAPQAHCQESTSCGHINFRPPLAPSQTRARYILRNCGKFTILMHATRESSIPAFQIRMKNSLKVLPLLPVFALACMGALAQGPSAGQPGGQVPVSYASVNQLNTMLGNLEQTAQNTNADLGKLRIDRWKTDSAAKRQSEGDVESLQRNLQAALPGLIAELRNSPEDVAATFKLYHNLDALHDVLRSVAENAGAFASRNEYQALANDADAIDTVRRGLADRMQTLATSKEAELTRLRTQLKAAQAAPPPPPKKIVVDDTEPEKKAPAKKKKPKPAATGDAAKQPNQNAQPQAPPKQ